MNIFPAQYAPAVLSQFFINGGTGDVIIDKIVARNNDAVTQSISMYLVSFGDTPGPQNLFVAETVGAGKTSMCSALVGSELAAGDTLWLQASVAGMIAVHANGRIRQ